MKHAAFLVFLLSVGVLLAVLLGPELFERAPAGRPGPLPPVQPPLALPPPPAPPPPSVPAAAPMSGPRVLTGTWTSEKPGGGGITRVEVRSGPDGPEVRMWGSCRPKDCDWGVPQAYNRQALADGVLALTWNHGFSARDQVLKLLPDGRLEIVTRTRFTDNSGRRDYEMNEFFRKSTVP